jgi:hypothetical protein
MMVSDCRHENKSRIFNFLMSVPAKPGMLRAGEVHAGCGAENVSEEEYKTWQVCFPVHKLVRIPILVYISELHR